MPNRQNYTIKLSQEEVLLISMNLHLPLMIGVDRKMLDLPREDVQGILQSAETTLLQRDYLRVDKDGTKNLAPIIVACMFTCARPEQTIIISRSSKAMAQETLMIHQSLEMIVNHFLDGSGAHIFTVLPDLNPAIEGILRLAQTSLYAKPISPEASLPESVYGEANQLAQGKNPGALYALLTRHLPEQTAVGFHQTLDNLEAVVTAVRLTHGEKAEDTKQDGFTLLQGGDIQWLMRSSGAAPERMLSLEGASEKDVRRELKKLLRGK